MKSTSSLSATPGADKIEPGGQVPISLVVDQESWLVNELASYHPINAAATFAGLLTCPHLQANTLRLEMLIHASLCLGRGSRLLSPQTAASWFSALSSGWCGRLEDPAEDVFVSRVDSSAGNFRLLEGIWECNGYYLQQTLDALRDVPLPGFDYVRQSAHALCRLSELVCERAGLQPHLAGAPLPGDDIPKGLVPLIPDFRRRVTFRWDDLRAIGILRELLEPFLYVMDDRSCIRNEALCNSSLERRPLACDDGAVWFLLPTAASASIRRYVLEQAILAGARIPFAGHLADTIASDVFLTPLLGRAGLPKPTFQVVRGALISKTIAEVEPGRFLGVVLLSDTFDDFEATGLGGIWEPSRAICNEVERCLLDLCAGVLSAPTYKDGICLLVNCGIGRGLRMELPALPSGWIPNPISAADLATLGWVKDFDALSLWRLERAERQIEGANVHLHNVNGLLNLVAWVQSLDGNLIPHHQLPDDFVQKDRPGRVMIQQNALRDLRGEIAQWSNRHGAPTINGGFERVQRVTRSLFQDEGVPLYFSDPRRGPGHFVYESATRWWWGAVKARKGDRSQLPDRWGMLQGWIRRIVPVVEQQVATIPSGPLMVVLDFDHPIGDTEDDAEAVTQDVLMRAVRVQRAQDRQIEIRAGEAFESALFDPTNRAERAVVYRVVEGILLLAEADSSPETIERLTAQIVPDTTARTCHRFRARQFRDFVRPATRPQPVTAHDYDGALIKVGIGWIARDRADGAIVEGKEACLAYLNALVAELEKRLCHCVAKFNRNAMIQRCMENLEAAEFDRDRWRLCTAAIVSLETDRERAARGISNHEFELNAVVQASRLLLEFAIPGASRTQGEQLHDMDLSLLMAQVMQLVGLGGWSDQIRWEALRPYVKISPLGDVGVEISPIDRVMEDFGRALSATRVEQDRSGYDAHFKPVETYQNVGALLDAEFNTAWREETGFTIDEARAFADFLEDLAINRQTSILTVFRSELLAFEAIGETRPGVAAAILDWTTFPDHSSRAEIPAGFERADQAPWKFRRRLSVLRRPIVVLCDASDPELIVAPGQFRDSLQYMLRNYHEGGFPDYQIATRRMKTWIGRSADRRGKAFTQEVAKVLGDLGWVVKTEVAMTHLMGRTLDRDYGDVDVLAWRPGDQRLLMIECKDVHFRKTPGEVAEQLSDFLGQSKADGKPDSLLRHLRRIEIARGNAADVGRFVGFTPTIEAHIVFKNRVPMAYAWQQLREKIDLTILSDVPTRFGTALDPSPP